MTLSREVLDPLAPRDIDRTQQEGRHTAQLSPGTVVVRTGPQTIVPCDVAGQATHMYANAELVWTDGARYDSEITLQDGTQVYTHTTLPCGGELVVDLNIATVFETGTPVAGSVIIKSLTVAGKLDALTPAEVDSGIGVDFTVQELLGLVVGVCEGEGNQGAAWARCRMRGA